MCGSTIKHEKAYFMQTFAVYNVFSSVQTDLT